MYYSKATVEKLVQHQKWTPKPLYLGINSSQGSYASSIVTICKPRTQTQTEIKMTLTFTLKCLC